MLTSGVLVMDRVPAWFGDELPPLVGHVVDGDPITQINPRQYGVVTFLIMHPVLALLGENDERADRTDRRLGLMPRTVVALDAWASFTQMAANLAALFLLNRRFFGGGIRSYAILAGVCFSFAPSIMAIAIRAADSWQLFFLSAALFLYTSNGSARILMAVPLAVGMLAKLLPAIVLAFFCTRYWRAASLAAGVGMLLLGIGHLLYGPLMGLAYPFAIASASSGIVEPISVHQENNSVRGLLYKAVAGWKLESDFRVEVPPSAAALNVLAYGLAFGLFAYLVWVGHRSRRVDSLSSRSLEFSLAIVTMLLISPATGYEYMMPTIIAFVVLWHLWIHRSPGQWAPWLGAMALVGFGVIGVFIPFSGLARIIPLESLMNVAGNASSSFVASPIGAYQFFGFPGLGLILTWVVLVIALERLIAEHGVDRASLRTSAGRMTLSSSV